jgi:uncharacterized protein
MSKERNLEPLLRHKFFGMIVDAHAHCDKKITWQHTPEQLLSMMRECGIKKSVLAPYWDLPAAGDPGATARFRSTILNYRDEFFGFLRLNPYDSKAEDLLIEYSHEGIICGLKLNPSTTSALPYGEPTMKLIRTAAGLGLPVLFHSGDDPLSTPLQIGKAAELCPTASIIIGHMGGYFYVEEAIEVARRNENVYLETSVMPYPLMIKAAVDKIGHDKIFFGSDGPGVSSRVEIAKVLASGVKHSHLETILVSGFQRLMVKR